MQPSLNLLGGFDLIDGRGASVRLPTRKSCGLLAVLALRPGHVIRREELATLLWGDSGEPQARASLRQELSMLRKALAAHDLDPVVARKDAVALASGALDIDAATLRSLIEAAEAKGSGDAALRIARLWRGDLLAGLEFRSEAFEDWMRIERERLRDRTLELLHAALSRGEAGEHRGEIARAILAIDGTHEGAHRALMRAYWQAGRRTEALNQFKRCAEALARDLDAEPSFETMDLLAEIRGAPDSAAPGQRAGRAPAAERRELSIAVVGLAADPDVGAEQADIDPETLSELLGGLFRDCAEAAADLGGTAIGLPDGRAILVFGHPRVDEADRERAIMAVLNLLSETATRGSRLRAGLSMGETLVSTGPGGLSVTGPAVMAAARLERAADAGEVRVSKQMAYAVRGAFQMGPADAAGSCAILSEKLHADRFFVSGAANRLTALVGREAEMRLLNARWQEARLGQGHCVRILGEAGIGKSRLLYAFKQQIVRQNPEILQLDCSPHHRESALYPVARHLRAELSLDRFADDDAKRQALSRWMARLENVGPETEARFAALLGLDCETGADLGEPEALFDVLIGLFRQIAAQRPVLLIVEDVHWIDPTSRVFLDRLVRAVERLPALIVITERPGDPESERTGPAGSEIALGRLPANMGAALVRDICPEGWSSEAVAQVVARSDGIPLYLEELVRTLEAGDGAATIPESLQASLSARIDRLADARGLLQAASVIGRVFDHATLAALLGQSGAELDALLRDLQRHDLVYRIGRPPYARYEFKHALMQEQAYRSLLKEDRVALHARLAAVLSAASVSPAPEVLARHYELGAEPELAIAQLERAGKQALRVSAHAEASAHFGRACELARTLPEPARAKTTELRFLLFRGPQLLAAHGFASAEVEATYGRALALAGETPDRDELLHLYWGLWSHYVVGADLAVAERIGAQMRRLAASLDDATGLVAGDYMLGVTAFYGARMDEAGARLEAACRGYTRAQHPDQIERFGLDLSVAARSYLGWCRALQGATGTAVEEARTAIAAAEALDHDFSAGFAHVFCAVMFHFLGRIDEAEAHGEVAAALSRGKGFRQWSAQTDMILGRVADRRGDATGLPRIAEGAARYAATGAGLALPVALAWQAECHLGRGAHATARGLVDDALERCKRTGMRHMEPDLLRLAALAAGEARKAEALLARAVAVAHERGMMLWELRAARELAAYQEARGDTAAAFHTLASARRPGCDPAQPEAQAVAAEIARLAKALASEGPAPDQGYLPARVVRE